MQNIITMQLKLPRQTALFKNYTFLFAIFCCLSSVHTFAESVYTPDDNCRENPPITAPSRYAVNTMNNCSTDALQRIGSSSSTNPQTYRLMNSGVAVNISTNTGLFGGGAAHDFNANETANGQGTYTISFAQPITDITLYLRNIGSADSGILDTSVPGIDFAGQALFGNFSVTLSNGTVLNNLVPTVTVYDNTHPVYNFNAEIETLGTTMANGIHYITDVTADANQASGVVSFAGLAGQVITEFRFDNDGDAGGPSSFWGLTACVADLTVIYGCDNEEAIARVGGSTNTSPQTYQLLGTTPVSVDVTTDTGLFGNGGGNDFNINETSAGQGTYTVTFGQPIANITLFLRSIGTNGSGILDTSIPGIDFAGQALFGNFTATLSDGTILSNLTPTVSSHPPGHPVYNANIDPGAIGTTTVNGVACVTDPTDDTEQAAGIVTFASLDGKAITQLSLEHIGDGIGPSSQWGMTFCPAEEIPDTGGGGGDPDPEPEPCQDSTMQAIDYYVPPQGRQYYVSPTGDNNNTGTRDAPFQTLERARDEIRTLTNPGDVVVWLMDGDYYLSSSFTLYTQDSGTDGNRITYAAENKHGAVLHFNKTVETSSFTPLTDPALTARLDPAAVGNIVQLDLAALGVQNMDTWPDYFPAANQELFRLYTDDFELPLSRYPNDSMMTMKRVLQNEPGIFEYRGTRHHRWLDAINDGLWFQGYWRVAWQYDAVRTASIDTIAGTVSQATSVPLGIGDKYTRPEGNGMEPYFATNLMEEIDMPGEWSVNFNTQMLYIWLPTGVSEVRILDNDASMIRLETVSNVSFVDLKLSYGLGEAFTVVRGSDVLIAGCDMSNFIKDAVNIVDGTGHQVISNDIHHLGAGGIFLSGGDRVTLTHANHKVVNNHIYEFGRVKVIYGAAVATPAKYSDNNVGMYVAHNEIHGTPHVGIHFFGNNNIFEYNEIYDICRVSNDMGAFYSWNDWTSYGNIIRYNYIHSSHQAHGAYFDDGDSGDLVHDNIFQGIDVGVFIGGGHDIIARNNLAVDCEKAVHVDNRGVSRGYNLQNTTMVNRVLSVDYQNPPWSEQYPTIVPVLDLDYAQDLPTGCIIDCNVGINTPTIVDIDATTATAWGVDLGTSYSNTDPALSETSSLAEIAAASGYDGAACIGEIPYTMIGLMDDPYRSPCIVGNPFDYSDIENYNNYHYQLQTAANVLESVSHVEVTSNVDYLAGNCIDLKPDFEVELGAEFLADIKPPCFTPVCDTTANRMLPSFAKSHDPNIKVIKKILHSDIYPEDEDGIVLKYQISKTEKVSIFLSDVNGNLVTYLENETLKTKGVHELKIKEALPEGRYYYTIEAESDGETKAFNVKK